MGDRNNPIKFGPEWLRNLSRERNVGNSGPSGQSPGSSGGPSQPAGTPPGPSGGPPNTSMAPNLSHSSSAKVQLAKLRYGREEMLALYDRSLEAPQELKYIDILYQPRGKPPVALNNSFEEEMRDTMRTGPPIGGIASGSGERFGNGRSIGRSLNVNDARGRPRATFVRQPSSSGGRGTTSWHMGSPRQPAYGGGPEDERGEALRSWNGPNGGNSSLARSNTEQSDWNNANKIYRNKRPGANSNWRSTREDEEWRASDANRARPPQDKWERDWGDRAQHRRTWVGGDQNDDLPEWAVDNADSCGGTFDASGAFHGYSNDDSNLPKSQEAGYALTRSNTHGSFSRSKTAEEGSDEWWASEKAKKLSPKRFDASDIKFKKPSAVLPDTSANTGTTTKLVFNQNKEDNLVPKGPEKLEATDSDNQENKAGSLDDAANKKNVRFAESKTFDALMRSDINLEDASDERGNFQSVMITPNNSLRQKHQHITVGNNNMQMRNAGILQMLQHSHNAQAIENELLKQRIPEDKLVENMLDLTLEDPRMMVSSGNDPMASISNTSDISKVLNSSKMSNQSPHVLQGLHQDPAMHAPPNISMHMQNPGYRAPQQGLQNVGITNSALNASLGLPLHPPSSISHGLGLGIQGASSGLPSQMNPVSSAGMPSQTNPVFPSGGGIPMPPGPHPSTVNSSLFMGQTPNSAPIQSPSDLPLGHGGPNMFPMHGLQHSGSFNSSIYNNMMPQQSSNSSNSQNPLSDQWYYEDPEKIVQGPFSAKEMYSWYRAGFFSPSLMVRRACDAMMRPLGSYGPMVPFAQMENILSPFPMGGGYEPRNQAPHDNMLNTQQGMGLDMDSLWGQPSPSPDLLWMQHPVNARPESRVNNLPVFFWDQQPSAMAPNSLLPEEIAKEMKTEDQILAQLRASQNIGTPPKMPFLKDLPLPTGPKPEEMVIPSMPSEMQGTPNLEDLQKLIQEDARIRSVLMFSKPPPPPPEPQQIATDLPTKNDHTTAEAEISKPQIAQSKQVAAETKPTKILTKTENEKPAKTKENAATKNKSGKKVKEDRKDEPVEVKSKDEQTAKIERRSEEPSPIKNKKEEKLNKKELEKERKEWVKEGFTIVKTEKPAKEAKKKADDGKAAEEAERKRKELEKATEDEKKRKQTEAVKTQQESLSASQSSRQAAESVGKKAPWSGVAVQAMQATSKDGLSLTDIQRLEREKKLEQMKEQQQMMQIIAQQQAAALAREREMQLGLGWAKKNKMTATGQSLTEIQAETRKQAASASAAAAVAAQTLEDVLPPVPLAPWTSAPQNGGGFWDTPAPAIQSRPVVEPPRPAPVEVTKVKKRVTLVTPTVTSGSVAMPPPPAKKEVTPAAEFDAWCGTVLMSWSAKIDVPTFVGFLKDIESPYEVKDYVKCYLGDTKDSNDFARQFLERRSKLLRVGMVTPSDDLCSPASALNPRTNSGSDYQEVKGKGKKTKKNKMLKVDAARLLGFSVTASEDRINVGDIDTA